MSTTFPPYVSSRHCERECDPWQRWCLAKPYSQNSSSIQGVTPLASGGVCGGESSVQQLHVFGPDLNAIARLGHEWTDYARLEEKDAAQL